jgi:putative PIN family toxin of toxin-antitoxin system
VTPRVLCDTNVLVSAFIAAGPPSRVIEAAIDGRIELVLAEVLDELDRVLIMKLGFTAERVRDVATLLSELASARVAAPTTVPPSITGDPDDDLILACSVDAGVQIIVSGDRKHLLPIVEYSGVRIVTPQTLLAELANA